jgi:YVTN family beta-propeller protein
MRLLGSTHHVFGAVVNRSIVAGRPSFEEVNLKRAVCRRPLRPFPGCVAWIGVALMLCALAIPTFLTAQTPSSPPITGGNFPWSLVVNPATNKVYVIDRNTANASLLIFDGATHRIINSSLNLPNGTANSIAVNPVTNMVYVVNSSGNKVTVIDGSTDTVVGTVSSVSSGGALVVNPVTNKIYVPNGGASSTSISVIDGSKCTATVTTCTATSITGLGANPVATAINPVTNKIYVANSNGNSVSVINGSTDTFIKTVTGTGTTPVAIQVNPVTNRVYVVNQGTNNVSIIDGTTDTLLPPPFISVGNNPHEIGINTVTNKIYIANAGNGTSNATVTVIDGATNATTPVAVGINPSSVSVNTITNKIYVTDADSARQAFISIIDGGNNSVVTLLLGNCPNGAAVNPETNRTYVANTGVGCNGGPANISVIDGTTNVLGTGATIGSGINGLVLNPLTNTLYATNPTAGVVAVSGTSLSVTSIALPSGGFAATVNPITNKVYVADNNSSLQVIDPENGNAVTPITVGSQPEGVAVNAATNKIYVTNSNSANMTAVNGTTNAVDATVPVGNRPIAVAANPATNRIYVANYNDGTVSVVNGLTNTVLATATVGTHPHDIQVNPLTNFIYVANQGGGAAGISVINGATNAVTQLGTPSGATPWAIAVDTSTNEIYVLNNQSTGSVTVVLGATSTTAAKLATTLPSGTTITNGTISLGASTTPNAILVNPITHRVYIASGGGNGLIFIDGPSGTVTTGPAGINGMAYLAVNSVTNLVYLTNSSGGQLNVVGPDGRPGSLLPTPLTTTIAGNPSDPLAISQGSATTAYQTANPAPVINVTVNSTYTTSSPYNTVPSATNPPPTTLYYMLDGGAPSSIVTPAQPSVNPATFSIALGNQQPGAHTLYVYPAYGNEGGSANSGSGTARGNMPELGNMASFAFLIAPIPTTTTVVADINPQLPSQSITFTATVTPLAIGAAGPTGTVAFYDVSNSSSPILLGTGTLNQVPGSYQASIATTALATPGAHPILAVYSGDPFYSPSNGTMTETINTTLTRLVVVGGGNQTFPYGSTPTFSPLIVKAEDSSGNPIPGATVTFSAPAGITLQASSCTTDATGQCSDFIASFSGGAGIYTITASATGSTPAFFTVTVTKVPLTVTATSTSRAYGVANPALAYTITGFVNGETSSVVSGAPDLTTVAINASPVGSYTITTTLGTLAAANYSFNLVNGTLTVVQATPATGSQTVLSIAPATVMYGDTSVLTAEISPEGATGTVTFTATPTAGGAVIVLGTASVDDTDMAVFPESTLGAGTYNITAHYNGDSNIAANTSNAVTLTVTQRTGPGGTGPALTVTVNDASRTTTEMNPPFSYTVAGTLVNGDTYATAVTGTPVYTSNTGTTPGTFPITVAGLTSANYVIALVQGTLTVVPTPTMTTLATSPASPQYGDPVTLTATVAPSGASGTVSFYNGAVFLGQGTVSGGVATLVTTTLNAGTHSITAIYNGDATYTSSTSSPATVTVSQKTAPGGGAALTVTVQNASREFGVADPQFEYVVTGTLVNGDTYPIAVTGVPTYTVADTPTSPVGSTFPISVSGLVSQNYVVSFVAGTLTIVTAPTTTELAASATSTQYGDPITLTAMVVPAGATGTVVFSSGATVLGMGTISSGGVATFATSSLNAGTYVITANYAGDGNFGASTSEPVTVTVAQKTAPGGGAALIVTVGNASRAYGQGNPVFTYSVTGTLVNGDTYQTAVTGVAVYSTTATVTSAVGTYPISLTEGLNSANYVIGYVNGTLTVTKGTPAVTVDSSQNPSPYSTSVTFTATVSAGATGTVTFMDGSTVLGTGSITGMTATFTTTALAVGSHPITAVYSGDSNYNGVTSSVLSQVVNKATPGTGGVAAVTVDSSLNPSVFGQSVTFTATVPSGATGTIIFEDNGVAISGAVTISGTTATFTTSTLVMGTHPITAVYSGDANFNGVTSTALSQVVAIATSTTTLSLNPTTVMYGNTSEMTAVVLPTGATGTVSFYAGTTLLGTSSLDGTGTAVFPESTLGVGTYSITAHYNGDLNLAANTSNAVQLTVTQRTGPSGGAALTVTVNDASRTTTETNPPFSYTVAGTLVNGDTYATAVTGTPAYTSNTGSTAGTFPITVTGLTSANYVITVLQGTLTVVPTPTTTTLSSSPASPQYGDPVTLTATVAPSGATGTVSFYDGAVYLGQGTLAGGVATLTTTTLNAGTHTITAIYNGDATYASSTSAPATVVVAKKTGPGPGGAALTVTVQNASREFGTANPQFANVVTGALVNGDTYPSAITGVPIYASTDTPGSPAGSTYPINVSGLVSQNYVVAVVPGTLTIVASPSTTTLAASATSTQYGDPVTLTATVVPSGATGTVIFSSGSTVLGTGTVSNGIATLTTSALNAGTYIITANYEGDSNFGASTSSPVTVTVAQKTGPGPGGAALTVTVANASRTYGQGNPAFTYAVTGTLVNGDTYQTAVTGVPVFSTSATTTSQVGSYPISLTEGLSSRNYVISFVSGTLTVGKGTPVVTVASSLNPSTYTASVTFTAVVSAGATGTITFMDGSTALGTATITGTTATLTTTTLATGTHPITAVYSGDANDNGVTSAVLSQVVNKATPGTGGIAAVTVVSNNNPSTFGQSVTLTATVPSGATGTVRFMDGSTLLGTATITGTTATFTTTTLAIGSHPITAVYSGDSNFNGASSAGLSQVVLSPADFAVSATPALQIIPPGASTNYGISVTSVTAPFTNPVTLAATGLPTGATYSFFPAAVTPGTAGATSSLTVTVPKQAAAASQMRAIAPITLATLLLPWMWVKRKTSGPPRLLVWLLLSLATLGSVMGCGVGGYFSQPQQTYTITVTGTSGSLMHSTTVTLTVE